jgi:hypothetical protein
MATVYISIGNSDDKLTQLQWHAFHAAVNALVRRFASRIYGDWVSPSTEMWQNACIAAEIPAEHIDVLKALLGRHAFDYLQDSIAWAEATTEFVAAQAPEAADDVR